MRATIKKTLVCLLAAVSLTAATYAIEWEYWHDTDLGNTVAGSGSAGGFEVDNGDSVVQERQHR